MQTKEIIPTDEQIDEVVDKCCTQIQQGGSKYPGMSYEQGLRDAIDWLTGDSEDIPLS